MLHGKSADRPFPTPTPPFTIPHQKSSFRVHARRKQQLRAGTLRESGTPLLGHAVGVLSILGQPAMKVCRPGGDDQICAAAAAAAAAALQKIDDAVVTTSARRSFFGAQRDASAARVLRCFEIRKTTYVYGKEWEGRK